MIQQNTQKKQSYNGKRKSMYVNYVDTGTYT